MWVPPRTWVPNEIVSAAQLNTQLRDELLETFPAKATAAGQLAVASGPNAISVLAHPGVAGQELRTSGVNTVGWSAAREQYRIKPNDEVRTTTALLADADLSFPVEANKTYTVDLFALATGTNVGNILYAWLVPAGSTFWTVGSYPGGNIANGASQINLVDTTPRIYAPAYAVLQIGATPGTANFIWGQTVAVATASVLKAGTLIRFTKVN